jgi:hypothetical protein
MERKSNVVEAPAPIKFKRGQYTRAKQLIMNIVSHPILWGREINLFKKLMGEYDFEYLMLITQKVSSLLWFFTDDGKQYLTNLKYNVLFKYERKDEYIKLEQHNVGEDVMVNGKRIRSIRDFLN